jgi:outer membrane immunogenic protein
MKWFGTARGRIGWVPVDGAMIYATGGGAWIGIDETDTIVSAPPVGFPPASTSASFGNTASGYAVGAGAEVRLWGNWTGKLEYLHLDVGGTSNAATHSAPPTIGPLVLTTTTGRITDDIFRVGLNYQFH